MARKNKEEEVNANNLRSANFADFEATHEFTAASKKADFSRAAIQAGLTNNEIIEIGDAIYGEGSMKANCLNWYRSSDPILNPGKERYKPTGAKTIEVKSKVLNYYNELEDDAKADFVNRLIEATGVETLINNSRIDTLKLIVPAELFPVKEKVAKKELTEVEKLIKKQEAAEKKAAKLKAELEAMQNDSAETAPVEASAEV